MNERQAQEWVRMLSEKGVHFDKGLSDREVREVEERYEFAFPPDLKLFLQTALPSSLGFPEWRLGLSYKPAAADVRRQLEWPWEGMHFDLKFSSFWVAEWGNRPDDLEDRVKIARVHYLAAPKLIPVFGHRYLPSLPCEMGNPVLSVYQTDIVYYGYDLPNYLAKQFRLALPSGSPKLNAPLREIEFWSRLVG